MSKVKMAISAQKKQHSFVITEIITAIKWEDHQSVRISESKQRSSYIIELISGNKLVGNIGVFIKVCSSRRSPWRYTFTKSHQNEIKRLSENMDATFIAFVNYNDGVAIIEYQRFKQLLDDHFEEVEWVSVSRELNEQYTLNGNDGKLKGKIAPRHFPKIVVDSATKIWEKKVSLIDRVANFF